ncbi:MAG TPA: PhzF family phenazine biosynthesis protein [Trebonia sp.]|nr:PhzF family phenazine biosynthesis protein [Trebonia sp.]
MRIPETIRLWASEPHDGSEGIDDFRDFRDFKIVDVFTGNPLEGNQLGVFLDGRGLDTDMMLNATREMNYSETVFFLPPEHPDADARVRIFTPGGELPFAGHPTLGSAWVIGEIFGKSTVTLELGVGNVPVELESEGGTTTFGRMSQPVPAWGPYDGTAEVLDALGVPDHQSSLPIEWYRNGPLNVYVEFPSEEAVAALAPDMGKLGRIPINLSCFARTEDGWITRMFAPALGVGEDPATGSAAGPLAVHLARHGRIKFGEEIEIRQGAQIHRPSVLYARVEGTGDAIERVLVGGRAVIVAHGVYRLR